MLLLQSSGQFPLQLVMMGAMLAVFYLFFIRPQSKKQKEQLIFQKELKKGDEVVTSSGIIGTIVNVGEKTVTLQISQKAVMEVLHSSVSKELTEEYKK